MYAIIEKGTDRLTIVKQKTVLSRILGVSTRTILRKEVFNSWETDKYVVYNPVREELKIKKPTILGYFRPIK